MSSSHLSVNQPIGVFDSGIGGLSVLRHLREQLPNEAYIYVADSQFAPYGDRSAEDILARSQHIARYLHSFCKAIVIACNTATSVAAQPLRAQWPDYPIIGMEPGIKPALAQSRTGKVGVLATTSTLNGEKYRALREQLVRHQDIIEQPCPGLVEAIESANHAQQTQLLEQYLEPLLDAECDVIVFGCTHYPFLRGVAETLAPDVHFIDTGPAVAAHLEDRLLQLCAIAPANRLHDTNLDGDCHCYTTGSVTEFNKLARQLLDTPITAGAFDY